jgi:hypothetical protein
MSEAACSRQLSLFSVGRQEVTVDFQGGQIVNDAGLLAVAQLVEGLGILDELAGRWPDPRCQAMVTHTGREILAQQIYQYLAGYFDFNDANCTRHDPLFRALAGVSPDDHPLASGSTSARFVHAYTRREADKPPEEREVLFEQREAQLQRIRLLNEYLVELFAKTRPQPPTHVILDLDGSEDAAYGQQQLTFWNLHYDQNQYYPLFVFDGVTGFPLAAWLRPGHVHDSCGAVDTLREVVQRLRQHFPGVTIFVRGDGAFGGPQMLDFCEAEGLSYAFGYSNHQGLKPRTAWFLEQVELYYRFYPEDHVQRFDEITDYQAGSWAHPRRLVVKTEIQSLGSNQRVVVSNLSGTPRAVYQEFYMQRGNVPERPIGELKNGLGSDRLSSPRFLANFQKLLAHVLSYAIVVLVREATVAGAAAAPAPDGVATASLPPAVTLPVVRVGQTEPVSVARVPVVRVAIGTAAASSEREASSPPPAEPLPSVAAGSGLRPLPPRTVPRAEVLQALEGRGLSLWDVSKWDVSSLRQQLFKVGALVKTSVRRIWFHFSSHWPREELFVQVCEAVNRYVERFHQRRVAATGPPG